MSAKKRLLIASPSKGGLGPHYFHLMEHLFRRDIPSYEADYTIECANHSLPMSRNILAGEAIARNYDRVVFLDTDHPMSFENMLRVLSHDHEAYPIVSPLYCLKRPGDPFFLGVRVPGSEADGSGMLPAVFLPTGCLSVAVSALHKIRDRFPEHVFYVQDNVLLPAGPKRTPETAFEFFPVGVNGPRTARSRMSRIKEILADYTDAKVAVSKIADAVFDEQEPGFLTGEDYFFSLLAYQTGIPMFLDTRLVIPHEGKICFPITDPSAVATRCEKIPSHEGDPSKW